MSAVWSCQRAGPREVRSAERVDMPREGARQAGRQVVGGDEVAKRRSESRPVERVVNGLAHPGVSEQAVLGVKRQLVVARSGVAE